MKLLLMSALLGASIAAGNSSPVPSFAKYPATEGLNGKAMLPHTENAQERMFRTVLREAITKGYNVVDGGTEHERRGPNFGGHYFLVQWGCGTNCMQAALIDGNSGQVFQLPRLPDSEQQGFSIPIGPADLRTLKFQTGSRLLGIPNVGDSYTYYYVLERSRWHFLEKLQTPKDEN